MVLRTLPSSAELVGLEARLGYTFGERRLLEQALCHPSCGGIYNNYRLAWLGDAVLKMVLSDELFQELPPPATLGQLHMRREALEAQASCAAFAGKLGLETMLAVGIGYEGNTPSERMLAEAFEAVLGAVFLDSGRNLDTVRHVFSVMQG